MRFLLVIRTCATCVLLTCAFGCGGQLTEPRVSCEAARPWDGFWCARGVSPAPPEDFLEYRSAPPARIVNATEGRLSDDVVRAWVLADIRRSRGDSWALNHFRYDIVDSNVLGPPGLNGTSDYMRAREADGVAMITCPKPVAEYIAAGVIYVSRAERERQPQLGLTEFVIVTVIRFTGESCEKTLRDGRTVTMETRPAGTLSWQLDTGEYREDSTVGSLWYQARDYKCDPGEPVVAFCARVQP